MIFPENIHRKTVVTRPLIRALLAGCTIAGGALATPTVAQRSAAPPTPSAPPSVGQAGTDPGKQERGASPPAGTAPTASGPAGAGYSLVPASPGDMGAYKLVPDGAGGYRLVPAAPGTVHTYRVIITPAVGTPAASGGASPAPPQAFYVGGQTSLIIQHVYPFHSPYQGAQSFLSRNETEATNTGTIYVGDRLCPRLEAYVDPEYSKGHGLSTGYGLGGFTNGDVVRTPTLDQNLYLARYFLRYVVPLGRGTEDVPQGETQLAGPRPTRRVAVWGGKMAVSDIFDVNRYANSTRTQFLNWGLINCAAYDYAADTRGYTQGVAAEYVLPDCTIRAGVFQMPKIANYIQLSSDYKNNNGQQVELEAHPRFLVTKAGPGIVRLLGYHNKAHMGDYRASLALALKNGTPPDITATETVGNSKYGAVLGFEQPLLDGGNTGLFGRLGYNDGRTEDFAYTECDRTGSLGAQISGARLTRRPDDVLAVALEQNDLSSAHKDYLAAGGYGFLLGDGRLHYGSERLLETYYSYQLSRHGAATTVSVTADYQFIHNPGYNQDRGTVSVPSLRVHLEF